VLRSTLELTRITFKLGTLNIENVNCLPLDQLTFEDSLSFCRAYKPRYHHKYRRLHPNQTLYRGLKIRLQQTTSLSCPNAPRPTLMSLHRLPENREDHLYM
jgi:hypothetical protein